MTTKEKKYQYWFTYGEVDDLLDALLECVAQCESAMSGALPDFVEQTVVDRRDSLLYLQKKLAQRLLP